MPIALLLEVERDTDSWWKRPTALRALGYVLFQRVDPALAEQIHAGNPHRPFTLSALANGRDNLHLRVTALNDAVAHALMRAAHTLVNAEPLVFGKLKNSRVAVRSASLDAVPYAGAATYADLACRPFRTHVELAFVTPTAFSQGGERHLPLPVPDLLLRGWARRWNAFAPPTYQLPDEVMAGAAARVGLASARLETKTVLLQAGAEPDARNTAKLVGFVGGVTLEALQPHAWQESERAAFACLTAFAPYCGTGVKTTQGMGLTLLEERR